MHLALKHALAHSPIYGIIKDESPRYDLIYERINTHSISILQYRRKQLAFNLQIAEATRLQDLCRETNTLFIINDHIALCKHIGADGVHLGQTDSSIIEARQALGNKSIIGVSCYNSLAYATDAEHQGADYIALGAMYASPTKPHAVKCSLKTLETIRSQITVPIVCIGGITFDNYQNPISAGADMVAMISSLW